MGGCASKPNASDFDEAPASPDQNPQVEAPAQGKTNGGEKEIDEKPLADLSEPENKPKAAAAAAEPVSSEIVAETPITNEEDVKVAAMSVDDKVEVNDNATVESVKEKEAEVKADQKPSATPSKEEFKSDDAPLVSL